MDKSVAQLELRLRTRFGKSSEDELQVCISSIAADAGFEVDIITQTKQQYFE